MKKLSTILITLLLTAAAAAQVTIVKEVDDMTDEISYSPSERFFVANDAKTEGFAIDAMLDVEDGMIYVQGWVVITASLGDCNEDNQMIVLFEDDTRITLNSFNDFNCDEVAFFALNLEQEAYIATKRIKKIRFKNGFSYDVYTNEVDYPNYFIQLYDAIENKNNQ